MTQQNPALEAVREALEKAIMQLTAYGANNTNFLREALTHLEVLAGNCLPELPFYKDLHLWQAEGRWCANFSYKPGHPDEPRIETPICEGPTPREAILAALAKIDGGGNE